ncbi:MAG TPA: ferritin [Longimicrobiales bacterium]|nr:ferritin [Longimicrobiales bacterium]
MLSQGIQDAINDQIHHELHSAYVYLSMSAYLEAANFAGFAQWMRMQAREEVNHGMKLFDYVNDRNGHVTLKALEQPPVNFKSALDVFEHALEHEKKVTSMIHSLYALATKENDYATQVALQWFINEQVEEEATATKVVDRLKIAGNDGAALLLLDRELGSRQAEGAGH